MSEDGAMGGGGGGSSSDSGLCMYKIPVAFRDNDDHAMALQIIKSLHHLENISKDIFSRLKNQVEEETARLENLNYRIHVAQDKIHKIAENSNKATTVISTAKYPYIHKDTLTDHVFGDMYYQLTPALDEEPELVSMLSVILSVVVSTKLLG